MMGDNRQLILSELKSDIIANYSVRRGQIKTFIRFSNEFKLFGCKVRRFNCFFRVIMAVFILHDGTCVSHLLLLVTLYVNEHLNPAARNCSSQEIAAVLQ
jgi:hypothetical protein